MPQRKTAKKALKQNKKRRQNNLQVIRGIKSTIKKLKKAIDAKDTSASQKALTDVYKTLDKAVNKKIIHRNKAARKKGQLSKLSKKTTTESS